ncbi:16S rRNA (cytosine967-C5)-methyltransferase [Spiroplasma corruscae]|uniref:16S rRNA (Cytosine967-C5)-methyltransferase n=1 Tax=Spiroplasma corruscae TaxID=216934 RepID=A0A222EN62_9MOLU|nr:16S rRNA (cytosine(967)-C(5))-methyltransferase RsmB [Spiroplasma corruscae]ASP27949.1 16S rRNA (cytosine967-C5)-methyltransferase [Spiroplasma corruscae]
MTPRHIALNILNKVIYNNQFSNKLLNKLKQNSKLSNSDIFFIFKLVYGVIQYKIYLQYVCDKLIKKEIPEKKIYLIIWMALYQLNYLKAEPYYVINEAVNLCKKINIKYVGLVNATLRNCIQESVWEINIKNKKNIKPLSQGIPYWLYSQIKNQYGNEVSDKWLLNINDETSLYVRVNTLKVSNTQFYLSYKDELSLEKVDKVNDFYKSSSKIFQIKLIEDGIVYIQDPLSGLTCQLLNPKKDNYILDMCCAPGGKLSYIYQLVNGKANIKGIELNLLKKNILLNNLKRLGIKNIDIEFIDALNFETSDVYDYILLDAPCSGYGVIKNKPEIRLKKYSDEEMNKLYDIQLSLLNKAYDLLKVNGSLVYSTCTINKKENEEMIKNFLALHKNIKIVFEKQYFGYEFNTNGFYMCKLIKL